VGKQGTVLRLGAEGWSIRADEVDVLLGWLAADGSLEAQAFSRTIRDELLRQRPQPVRLGLDDIAALRAVLCGVEMGDYHGLRGIQAAICVGSGEPREDGAA